MPVTIGAQSSGAIRGAVTSADQLPVSGARLAIESPVRVAITDQEGKYVLRDLPAGHYDVLVSALGQAPKHNEVDVTAGQTAELNVTLERGSLLLSSVIVSATRTPVEANKVATTINVLTPELVRTSPARESQDLLREIPGIELPRTSSLVGGTAQIVSIRGVDEGRTAVLFDGIPINDAWGEWIDWGRVPRAMIDRVEVIEGGTSNLYGNGAMGGVISYFSRPIAPGDYQVTVDGGSRSLQHVYAGGGLPITPTLNAYVNGDYQSGGGYGLLDPASAGSIDVPSEIIQRNAYARLLFTPSSTMSAFVEGHKFGDNRNLGTPLSYGTRDQGNIDLGVDLGAYTSGRLTVRAWDGRQDETQRSTNIRSGGRVAEDSSVNALIPSHDWGGSAVWTRSEIGKLESFSVGGDFRSMSGNYDETDYNTTCPGASCGWVSRTVFSGGDQSLSGLFAQAIVAPAAAWRIELSARVDRWTNNNGKSVDLAAGTVTYPNRSKNSFSPRAGVRYQVTPGLSLHAAVYRSFRAPNLAELYRKQISGTQITIPNPDLKPETANGREAGLDWQPAAWLQFKGTWYVADYNDFNVPVQIDAGPPATRQRLNVSKSRSKGGEAYVALRPVPQLLVAASVNYDDDRVVDGPAGTVVGAHINRVPSPKQNVRLTWSSQKAGEWTVIWRHEGKTTTLRGAWLDPYTVVDASVQRDLLPGLTGFVAVENVGDVSYQVNVSGSGTSAIYSVGLPRTIRAGLTATRF